MSSDRIIFGIDPGTNIMGYGLILNKGKKIELIKMGILKLSAYKDHNIKLKKIFDVTLGIIDEYNPVVNISENIDTLYNVLTDIYLTGGYIDSNIDYIEITQSDVTGYNSPISNVSNIYTNSYDTLFDFNDTGATSFDTPLAPVTSPQLSLYGQTIQS